MIRKNIQDMYPLSPMQQGMLFHSLLTPESGAYNELLTCKLSGDLDVPALEQAWHHVVNHYTALRTVFAWEGMDEPLQVVNREVALPIVQLNWRHLTTTEQQDCLKNFLDAEHHKGFALTRAPLMRLFLIQLDERVYQFAWSYHHLLLDGWSSAIILNDVFSVYEASISGKEYYLPTARPYRDYIAWLQNQNLAKAEAFWRHLLGGFKNPNSLVVARKWEHGTGDNVDFPLLEVDMSTEHTEILLALARQHQLTINTFVQGAWALLLHRYSGDDTIVFGATVAGRPTNLTGIENMVGLFINTLPLRVQISENVSLVSWLKQIQQQQFEMREFEYTPLVQVQKWSAAPQDRPLFESILVFENYPVSESLKKGRWHLQIDDIRSFEQTNYPLTIVAGLAQQLTIKISYDSSKFEAATIQRMLHHLKTLLESMAINPYRPIVTLPALTATERDQLLSQWNDTTADFPAIHNQCIHQLFEAQVRKTPKAVAIVHDDKKLTYEALNKRANQLAHFLKKSGAGPEALIGIYTERSLEMLIGLLGILKAGAAYVPLDPTYPGERISYMITDSGVAIILTQKHLVEKLNGYNTRAICLDSDWDKIAVEAGTNMENEAIPENLAYVIYTSGSTGTPKGVLLQHRGLCNNIYAMMTGWKISSDNRVFQFAPFSFDASVCEIFMTLLGGATLYMVQKEMMFSSENLFQFLVNNRITSIILPPSMLDILPSENLPDLQTVISAGETCTVAIAKKWSGNHQFFNGYGPTESTIASSWYRVAWINPDTTVVPIGRPISNSRLFILDKSLNPVPVGVPGELYIGGIGLARGYLNRPDLTAEKFIPDPFSHEPGTRLYRSGDLVHFQPDGNIVFLGRIDNQVKIRGFRVELEEIERVLVQHHEVKQAAVLALKDSPGDTRLVAYMVAQNGTPPGVKELRSFLAKTLPDYMIPSIFLPLESLPLLPNGKVNRKALPTPAAMEIAPAEPYVAPRSTTEELLAGIWSQVLAIDRVGVFDNFFELGGHSLLATRLSSRIREAFKIELPLHTVFDAPTVAGLAGQIDHTRSKESGLVVPPVKPIARDYRTELPLSFAQQRLWFLDQLAPGNTFYNIPTAIRLTGIFDVQALEQSLNEIIRRHETLRTTFTSQAGKPAQAIAEKFTLKLEKIDLSDLPATERPGKARKIAVDQAEQAFDLETGPLLRALVLKLDENDHIVLVTMHHIISDGWSVGIFIHEIAALYKAFIDGRPSPLPALSIQYADFATWQREWLQGNILATQMAYWRSKLAGIPAVLELPLDRPRPALQSFHGAQLPFRLSQNLSQALVKLSRQQSVTLFMTLLAALQTLLHRYAGQDVISIGTPIANRTQPETENLIGFFVNTLVMCADFSDNPTFRQLLVRVRATALEAYAHQDLPFEKLVEALQPGRDLSHTPLFQVMFVHQNVPVQEIELPGLIVTPFDVETHSTQFDLTVTVVEGPEELVGAIQYNTDLFDTATIQRFVLHLQTLLEGVVTNPNKRVSALPLLTESEIAQILAEWNDVTVTPDAIAGNCLHRLFEDQVIRTPNATAVVFESAHLSYADLNRKANQLAHYLHHAGIEPDVAVAICLERSPEMIVAVLAILKAGGAFVALDASYPEDRLAYMLADSGAPVLITRSSLVAGLPGNNTRRILLDADWPIIAREQEDNPNSNTTPENLAYIIYTSGSTGKPKGVLLRQQGLVNLSEAQQYAFGVTTGNNILQFSSLSFDASVWEIVMALRSGATLHLANSDHLIPGVDMIELLKERKIQTITLPPSILTALPEDDLSELKTIIAAGEALPQVLVNRWCQGRRFFNAYGPTEVTVCASYKLCNDNNQVMPTIGRPILNCPIYLLDRYLNLVPVGIPGEIYVGGVGLARGYLNRPDLTAASFIPDPFSQQPGARLYKTGDLARYRPDGEIEFLGRIDHQVKVRGFRIELGEIEAVLRRHPALTAVHVMAREDQPGDKRLVAYLVAGAEPAPDIGELKSYLHEQLPDYMIPATFIFLDEFPLTTSGKVDRQALPAPDRSRMKLDQTYVAPRNPVEATTAEICAQILNIDRVGIYDNFFELGGHSLLATQFMAQLTSSFNIDLPLRKLFEKPTVADLAEEIQQLQQVGTGRKTPVITQVARESIRIKRSKLLS